MLIWYVAGTVAAIVIAWLAALVHASGHAPIVLVPLVFGIALGATLTKLAAARRVTGRARLVIGAILLAHIAILAEHAWLYLDFRQQWHEAREKSPQVAIFRPEQAWSPRDFFINEATPERVVVWCVDGMFIIFSTTATVAILSKNATPLSPVPNP